MIKKWLLESVPRNDKVVRPPAVADRDIGRQIPTKKPGQPSAVSSNSVARTWRWVGRPAVGDVGAVWATHSVLALCCPHRATGAGVDLMIVDGIIGGVQHRAQEHLEGVAIVEDSLLASGGGVEDITL